MIYESNEVKKKNGFEYKEQRMAIDTGDRVNDINIQNAVIHVLDMNAEEPILNEYALDLTEDTYMFLYKQFSNHICCKCNRSNVINFNLIECVRCNMFSCLFKITYSGSVCIDFHNFIQSIRRNNTFILL